MAIIHFVKHVRHITACINENAAYQLWENAQWDLREYIFITLQSYNNNDNKTLLRIYLKIPSVESRLVDCYFVQASQVDHIIRKQFFLCEQHMTFSVSWVILNFLHVTEWILGGGKLISMLISTREYHRTRTVDQDYLKMPVRHASVTPQYRV